MIIVLQMMQSQHTNVFLLLYFFKNLLKFVFLLMLHIVCSQHYDDSDVLLHSSWYTSITSSTINLKQCLMFAFLNKVRGESTVRVKLFVLCNLIWCSAAVFPLSLHAPVLSRQTHKLDS